MKSMQNTSYIMEIWLEHYEITEIFENLKQNVNLQILGKSNTQAFLSTAEREKQKKNNTKQQQQHKKEKSTNNNKNTQHNCVLLARNP